MAHATQLIAAQSALLVIDVQEKLIPLVPDSRAIVRNIAFLLDAARLLEVPVVATEQYPKGLGPTVSALAEKIPERPDKVVFSSCGAPGVTQKFHAESRSRIVLAGIESHVCVLNTALDLLAAGFHVYLAVDAIGSRYAIDHETAIRRLENAGVTLTTVETVVFEWTAGANHPRFKEISVLVQARMKSLA